MQTRLQGCALIVPLVLYALAATGFSELDSRLELQSTRLAVTDAALDAPAELCARSGWLSSPLNVTFVMTPGGGPRQYREFLLQRAVRLEVSRRPLVSPLDEPDTSDEAASGEIDPAADDLAAATTPADEGGRVTPLPAHDLPGSLWSRVLSMRRTARTLVLAVRYELGGAWRRPAAFGAAAAGPFAAVANLSGVRTLRCPRGVAACDAVRIAQVSAEPWSEYCVTVRLAPTDGAVDGPTGVGVGAGAGAGAGAGGGLLRLALTQPTEVAKWADVAVRCVLFALLWRTLTWYRRLLSAFLYADWLPPQKLAFHWVLIPLPCPMCNGRYADWLPPQKLVGHVVASAALLVNPATPLQQLLVGGATHDAVTRVGLAATYTTLLLFALVTVEAARLRGRAAAAAPFWLPKLVLAACTGVVAALVLLRDFPTGFCGLDASALRGRLYDNSRHSYAGRRGGVRLPVELDAVGWQGDATVLASAVSALLSVWALLFLGLLLGFLFDEAVEPNAGSMLNAADDDDAAAAAASTSSCSAFPAAAASGSARAAPELRLRSSDVLALTMGLPLLLGLGALDFGALTLPTQPPPPPFDSPALRLWLLATLVVGTAWAWSPLDAMASLIGTDALRRRTERALRQVGKQLGRPPPLREAPHGGAAGGAGGGGGGGGDGMPDATTATPRPAKSRQAAGQAMVPNDLSQCAPEQKFGQITSLYTGFDLHLPSGLRPERLLQQRRRRRRGHEGAIAASSLAAGVPGGHDQGGGAPAASASASSASASSAALSVAPLGWLSTHMSCVAHTLPSWQPCALLAAVLSVVLVAAFGLVDVPAAQAVAAGGAWEAALAHAATAAAAARATDDPNLNASSAVLLLSPSRRQSSTGCPSPLQPYDPLLCSGVDVAGGEPVRFEVRGVTPLQGTMRLSGRLYNRAAFAAATATATTTATTAAAAAAATDAPTAGAPGGGSGTPGGGTPLPFAVGFVERRNVTVTLDGRQHALQPWARVHGPRTTERSFYCPPREAACAPLRLAWEDGLTWAQYRYTLRLEPHPQPSPSFGASTFSSSSSSSATHAAAADGREALGDLTLLAETIDAASQRARLTLDVSCAAAALLLLLICVGCLYRGEGRRTPQQLALPWGLLAVARHGQSGGLGWAIAANHGLVRLHLKAWGWPSDS